MFTYIKNKYNQDPLWVLEGSESPRDLFRFNIEFDVAPYLKLPKTVEAFHEMHKAKFWYNIKRDEKLFVNEFGPLNFVVTADKEMLLQYLPRIQELFAARWAKAYTSFDWKTKEGFQKYHEAMLDLADTGHGEIAVLLNKQSVLAFAYALKYNKTYYFFQHAVTTNPLYRKFSLGKIFIKQLITSTIQREFEIFDFMTGSQGYKREWADGEKKVYIQISAKKTLRGFLTSAPEVLFYSLRSFIHKNKKIESFLKNLIKLSSL